MFVELHRLDGVVFVSPLGRLDYEASADFCRALSDGLCVDDDRVVLDLSGVDILSPGPVGLIVSLSRLFHYRGVLFALCGAASPAYALLTDAGLDPALAVHDDRHAAVGSLDPFRARL